MEKPAAKTRLVSLDTLRGFDMFWIIGADQVIRSLAALSPSTPFQFLGGQFSHVEWAGMTFYDLVFPLFIFISGVSIAIAVPRQLERQGRRATLMSIARRTLLLFVLGIIYSGGWARGWEGVRWLGILQRIGLVYGVVATLFCFVRVRGLVAIGAGILLGYWAVLAWVPVRSIQLEKMTLAARLGSQEPTPSQISDAFLSEHDWVVGRYEPGLNVAHHADFVYLPGKLYYAYWDPEGLLSTFPSLVTGMIGVLAGVWLTRTGLNDRTRLLRLVFAGASLLAVGWIWHPWFPVIKNLWTSSFVFVTGGWSLLLLAAFHYLIDLRGWSRFCAPFLWIGMNPITLYMASSLISFRQIASRLVGPDFQRWLDGSLHQGAGQLLLTSVAFSFMLLLAWFLHRRQIFLRV
jgi:predicted acyltransferase